MSEKQLETMQRIAKIPKPDITLTYFRSDLCPHCKAVDPIIEKYAREHPEVALIKIDADATEQATNMLEAVLKGKLEVPTVVVNNQIIVKGDANFLPRLTYAIALAKRTPPLKEETLKWHLRR